MGRLVRIAGAAIAIALLGAALPVTALSAVASTVSVAEAPVVSASSDEDRTVRLEWFSGSDIDSIEIVAQDAAGAITTRTVPAANGSVVLSDVLPGDWSAAVTALSAGTRSESVPVWVRVLGPVTSPAPPATPPSSGDPADMPATPTETAAPVAVDLAIVPGPDGGLGGAQAQVTATGLGVGSAYRVFLAPLGTVLLDGVVDATGAVTGSAPLPAGLEAGAYTLEFTGTDGVGAPVTSSYAFDIASATPAPAAPTAVPEPEEELAPADGLAAILDSEGDAAVPYLVAGAVGATAVAGGAAAAASALNARARRLRLGRILDAEFLGGGSAASPQGPSSPIGSLLDRIRGMR